MLGVNPKELAFACQLYSIPIPSAGYWTLVQMGRAPTPDPLPAIRQEFRYLMFEGGRLVKPPIELLVILVKEGNDAGRTLASHLLNSGKAVQARQVRAAQLALSKASKIAERDAKKEESAGKEASRLGRKQLTDAQSLLLLRLCSSGVPRKDIASRLGVSYSTATQRIERAKRVVRKKTNWPRDVVDHLFGPRPRGRPSNSQRYTAEALTPERAIDLSDWSKAAWEVYQAQALMEDFGLEELHIQELFRTGFEPI